MMRAAFLVLVLMCSGAAAVPAQAQDYPSKPIRWIVPYPPGGGADTLARVVTQRLSQIVKQSVVVDNRPGGNTIIGTQALLSSANDGYTVLHTAEQIAVNSSLYAELKYSAERDLQFIAPMVRTPMVLLARPGLPVTDAASLFAYMKERGDKVTFGSWGQGGMSHLVMEAFADRIGVRPTHIPFQGAAPAIQNLLGEQIDLYFSDPTTALPHVRAGKLKALLVSTRERLPYLPNVPTVHESGYQGFDMSTWQGLVAPKGVPPAVVQALAAAVRQTLQDPEVRKELVDRAFILDSGTPEQFRETFMRTQADLGSVVRRLNIRLQ
jgi:tripartite-type tricarboxylate transporter receptor subunit TctC